MNPHISLSHPETPLSAAIISILCNILLAVFKLTAAVFSDSGAILSDGIHSLCDVCTNLVVLIGLKISSKPPDRTHPFGHERFESVSTILLSVILFITGSILGKNALYAIITHRYESIPSTNVLPIIITLICIFFKEGIYRFLRGIALRSDSCALLADAYHHRSDALSSVGALFGILGTKAGIPICDPIASLLICCFILKSAIDIFTDAVNRITDHACTPELEHQLRVVIANHPGVQNISLLHTRTSGNSFYAEAEIIADCNESFRELYLLSTQIKQSLKQNFPNLKEIYIQIKPNEISNAV